MTRLFAAAPGAAPLVERLEAELPAAEDEVAPRPPADLGLRRRLSVRMHADEVDTDPSLVQRLVAAQFPEWADLPIEAVLPLGTDNANYRLGADKLVRLPRRRARSPGLERELEWLPRLGRRCRSRSRSRSGAASRRTASRSRGRSYTWVEGENVERSADPRPATRGGRARRARARDPGPRPDGRAARTASRHAARVWTTGSAAGAARLDRALRRRRAACGAGTRRSSFATGTARPDWCHCDLDLRNLLFRRRDVRAEPLDWGGAGLGDPASDAADRVEGAAGRGARRPSGTLSAPTTPRSRAPAAGRSCSAPVRSRTTRPRTIRRSTSRPSAGSTSFSVPLPDDPEALEREERLDVADRA